MACLDNCNPLHLLPASLFEPASLMPQVSRLLLSSAQGSGDTTTTPHAFSILGRILSDPAFTPAAIGLPLEEGVYAEFDLIVDKVGDKLRAFSDEWVVEPTKESLEERTIEVIWMNTLIYTLSGYATRESGDDEKKKFRADFYL